jgi:hypothetical protein
VGVLQVRACSIFNIRSFVATPPGGLGYRMAFLHCIYTFGPGLQPISYLQFAAMPHANPKKPANFRLDPELLRSVQTQAERQGVNVTDAVEDGLRRWLANAGRGKAKPAAPSTARERKARKSEAEPL